VQAHKSAQAQDKAVTTKATFKEMTVINQTATYVGAALAMTQCLLKINLAQSAHRSAGQ